MVKYRENRCRAIGLCVNISQRFGFINVLVVFLYKVMFVLHKVVLCILSCILLSGHHIYIYIVVRYNKLI